MQSMIKILCFIIKKFIAFTHSMRFKTKYIKGRTVVYLNTYLIINLKNVWGKATEF